MQRQFERSVNAQFAAPKKFRLHFCCEIVNKNNTEAKGSNVQRMWESGREPVKCRPAQVQYSKNSSELQHILKYLESASLDTCKGAFRDSQIHKTGTSVFNILPSSTLVVRYGSGDVDLRSAEPTDCL